MIGRPVLGTMLPHPSDRSIGLVLAALAALFASSAGVLVRQVEGADAWSVLVYRALGFVAAVLLFILIRHGKNTAASFVRIGRPGLVVAVSLGSAFVAFVLALIQTNVATVVAVLGVSPMVAALVSWAALGERPPLLGWLAMAIAFLGVAVVVWGGLQAGSLAGLALAIFACLGYAVAIVGLRAGKAIDMSPAICLSGIVAGLVSLLLVDGMITSRDVVVVGLLLGTVQIGAQYILLTIATRFAPASDVALVMILEVVLAPLWVWIFVGESVPALALAGGGIIIGALVLNALASRGRVTAQSP
ncbi:MAG: DMT family transporter [Pseudomonadota bacterium]